MLCKWLHILVLYASFFAPPPNFVQSRTLFGQVKATASLDVSASIQRTKHILSSNPQTSQALQLQGARDEQRRASSTYGPLSLPIQSRNTLDRASNANYNSLLLSRLKRDSARVKSIISQINKSIDFADEEEVFGIDDAIQGPVLSGDGMGSGEYFTRIGLCSPPRELYMIIDSGSDITWAQCQPCTMCYSQSDPLFDPSLSSSIKHCGSSSRHINSTFLQTSQCRNDTCVYELFYGDGSFTAGELVTETITLGSASVKEVAMGCGHASMGSFIGAGGLLGLGGGNLSFPSQINASSFSYCLVNHDSNSTSTLEFNPSLPSNSVAAPLQRSNQIDTFLFVRLAGISVGGELLPIPDSLFSLNENGEGGVVMDTGTSVTRFPANAYASLRDAFAKGMKGVPSTDGVELFDTCYNLSSWTTVEVPTMEFHFPDGTLQLPPENYMIPVDSDGAFCLAFAATESLISIVGNIQQQGMRVNFDLDNSVIGFLPNQC